MWKITEQPSPYLAKHTLGGTYSTPMRAGDWIERNIGEIICCEEDTDHPGFYDLFVAPGRVLAIEPVV